jgi:hypothetical protein
VTETHPDAPIRLDAIPVPRDFEPLTIGVDTFMYLSGLGMTKTYALICSGELESVVVGRRRLINYQSEKRLLTTPRPKRGRPPGAPPDPPPQSADALSSREPPALALAGCKRGRPRKSPAPTPTAAAK